MLSQGTLICVKLTPVYFIIPSCVLGMIAAPLCDCGEQRLPLRLEPTLITITSVIQGELLDVNFLFLSFLPVKYDDSSIILTGLLRAMPDIWHTVIQVFAVVSSISLYPKEKSEHRELSMIP